MGRCKQFQCLRSPVLILIIQGTISGKNALTGEHFVNEILFRGRTDDYEGRLVFTEMKETVDPKAEEIMLKTA
jgi:hypothetical protein